jgi:hypothetical protein
MSGKTKERRLSITSKRVFETVEYVNFYDNKAASGIWCGRNGYGMRIQNWIFSNTNGPRKRELVEQFGGEGKHELTNCVFCVTDEGK